MLLKKPPRHTPRVAFAVKHLQTIQETRHSEIYTAVASDGEVMVLKHVHSEEMFECERSALLALRHPNIIRYYGTAAPRTLLLDYCNEGSLLHVLTQSAVFIDKQTRIRWIRDLIQALCYIHARGFLHGDLKPQNILVHDNELRIADFGMARQMAFGNPHLNGTIGYEAPEQRESGVYDTKSEIFAIGLVIYNILTAEHIFDLENEKNQAFYDNIETEVKAKLRLIPREYRKIIFEMLRTSPSDRPSLEQVYQTISAIHSELF